MISPDNLFWHLFQREEAKLPVPFTTLTPQDRAAVLDRVRETIEQILAMGGMEEPQGGGAPGDIVYTTRGGNFSAPMPLVVLGKFLRIEDLPNHDGDHAGYVLVFEGAAAMINFGPNDFVIPAEQMWFGEYLCREEPVFEAPLNAAASLEFSPLSWKPATAPFTVPASEIRYVRQAQQPQPQG